MRALSDQPVRTMLTRPSFDALLLGHGEAMPAAITIASDLDSNSVFDAPLLATTRPMIQRAQSLGV